MTNFELYLIILKEGSPRVQIGFWQGEELVTNYGSCIPNQECYAIVPLSEVMDAISEYDYEQAREIEVNLDNLLQDISEEIPGECLCTAIHTEHQGIYHEIWCPAHPSNTTRLVGFSPGLRLIGTVTGQYEVKRTNEDEQ